MCHTDNIMKDILLVTANNLGTYRSAKITSESLGIGLLSAVVEKKNYECDIIDARLYDLSPQEVSENINNYLVLGISIFSFEAIPWVKEISNICKKKNPDILIVAGGYAPTLSTQQVLDAVPNIDVVIRGEGENTIVEILESFHNRETFDTIKGIVFKKENQYIWTEKRPLLKNLDINPFPKRYAQNFADKNFEVLIEGSRGCENNCTFCGVKPFFGNDKLLHWRYRSAKSLIDELKYISKIYPCSRRIRFVDPDFLGLNPDGINRAVEFCDLLKKNKMEGYQFCCETRVSTVREENKYVFDKLKEAGFVEIYLGIESGSDHILKTMNKRITSKDSLRAAHLLKSWEIDFVYGFMMFTPWSKYEDIKENIEFLREIGDVQFDKLFHKLELIPNTPSVVYAKNKGLLLEFNANGYYNYKFESDEIYRLSIVWSYLQNYHIEFLQKIWYVYKDFKFWRQTEGKMVEKQLRELTEVSLEIFEDLCECCKQNNILSNERNPEVDDILHRYESRLNELEKRVNKKYCFPRNKMPGGA